MMRLVKSFAVWMLAVAVGVLSCTGLQAQSGAGANAASPAAAPSQLADSQHRLADRFERLELLAGRLAELSRATQPRRARLLRELITLSREQDISGRFAAIVAALQQGSLATALPGQQELQQDLEQLLELLLQEDREQKMQSQRKRILKYLQELKKLIRRQRGISARTEGGDAQQKTTADQQQLARQVGQLRQVLETNEALNKSAADASQSEPRAGDASDQTTPPSADADGKQAAPQQPSSGGQPSGPQAEPRQPAGQPQPGRPGSAQQDARAAGASGSPSAQQSPLDRAAERLQQAQQRMRQAKKKLAEAQREQALEKQRQAMQELERAKAELQRILRQLREEELERTLVLLEARFRQMLREQVAVYEETKKLASQQIAVQPHEIEIRCGQLRRREESIAQDADQALVLLREDGTSVAFPEALEQTRDDMLAAAQRLGDVQLDALTVGLEEDIMEALEEILAALQQALEELREQQAGQPSAGEPGEQSLVDQLAELRMIRALQARVNRRTRRYGELLGERQARAEDVRGELAELARRQAAIYRATQDLETGRNQ